MKFAHAIVTTGRADLLSQAVDSIEPIWPQAFILDNSSNAKISQMDWAIPVIRPSSPLSCAQSMNFLQRMAVERKLDAWGYQHEDVVAPPTKIELFLEDVLQTVKSKINWATIFTSYDLISAYNPVAVADIGLWDWMFPDPNYFIDTDWFYRAALKGYSLDGLKRPEYKYGMIHLEGGSSSSKSHINQTIRDALSGMNEDYYLQKWGGPPHQEKYLTAWNL